MTPTAVQLIVATLFFAAILRIFSAKFFAHPAHPRPVHADKSSKEVSVLDYPDDHVVDNDPG